MEPTPSDCQINDHVSIAIQKSAEYFAWPKNEYGGRIRVLRAARDNINAAIAAVEKQEEVVKK